MKPPYELTTEILKLVASISQKIGEVNARFLFKTNPILRKQNRIKTIHSSLQIEGNTLSESQITEIIENKKVIGPKKDILEVTNAIEVYSQLKVFNYQNEKDFLKAHNVLLRNIIPNSGKYRTQGVGIVKGSAVEHLAPPYENIPFLMKDLFKYAKEKSELSLIKSCVFHYELEFIHPFIDGNGRMGRLWQTLILMDEYPIFEFIPFENLIAKNQRSYYKALSDSDKEGKSTKFILFMLKIIDQSLGEVMKESIKKLSENDRLSIFLEHIGDKEFTRKDYLNYFKDLSTATASRDLKTAVLKKRIKKFGDKKTTSYLKR